ncbi:MAG: rRNA cytosine-C5-methyltransferase [Prevotellaceae bacterium]|jgi:16S rRNA C967 or C1407 C5-methylase (RsmB/RsmF family)/NOL1/NOP2/fmu family ribosome biogenesis protein|nr:rRNA cytosine-C5-methyltransferase [Prevotellaceae bacterium]
MLPQAFKDNMRAILNDDFADFESSLHNISPVSIRLNSGVKVPVNGLDIPLADAVAWCGSGKYLAERPSFTLDPLFHTGSYYVQEAASMFVEQCANTVKQYAEINYILDLCAAPGGKFTHLLSLFPDSLLVGNEVIRSRAAILEENISGWGSPNAIVTSCDPSRFQKLAGFFDFILVDAPCSGEGMFRKDHKAMDEWSVEHVKHCAARQLRIVQDIWNSLKPGGFLLYGTCTYNIEENENVVKFIIENLGAESIPVDISAFAGISPSLNRNIHAYRFFPHKTQSEGLFLSLIRKNGELKPNAVKKAKQASKIPQLKSWLLPDDRFICLNSNEHISFFQERFAADVELIGKTVHTLSSGTEICTIKGKDFIPSPNFALSTEINVNNFVTWEVDKITALKFLKKETLTAPPGAEKGYLLLTYKGTPLGWVKNIGSRCNNLLPPNRRILTF